MDIYMLANALAGHVAEFILSSLQKANRISTLVFGSVVVVVKLSKKVGLKVYSDHFQG